MVNLNGAPAETKPETPEAVPEFVRGSLSKLRPVLKGDLPAMAALMCEAPLGFDYSPEPWTTQRLLKKFEDEKKPGLWAREQRWYVVTDLKGELQGVLREEMNRVGCVDLAPHIAEDDAQRDALGFDALQTYMDYKHSWYQTPRISVSLLETQYMERGWLERAGFSLEIRCERAWMHLGSLLAMEHYAWLNGWVRSNRAADGIGV